MAMITLDEILIPQDISFLILEDTPVFQKKLLMSLGDIGFSGKISIASTILEAEELIAKFKFDFILSDWNLPDGQGIEFLRTVRSINDYVRTPVLMVTTIDDIDNILEAVSEGADGYIVKPWQEKDLIEKISFAYNKRMKIIQQ